jgi:hypothetical protein
VYSYGSTPDAGGMGSSCRPEGMVHRAGLDGA